MTTKTILINVEKPTEEKLRSLGVFSWPIWTKKVSKFDWHYDEQEICYFLEGEVIVSAKNETVSFGKGDLVIFPQGMDCSWHVKKAVRKHITK